MSDLTKLAAQTPLIDLLRGVPADARMTYEVNPTHHHMIPVGRLCADAVADLSNLAAELANVIADYDAAAYAMAALKQQNDSLRARQAVLVEALGTRLFIDCEWNDWQGDLISMALVGEDGREWYEVLECRDPSPWVAEHVMPGLGKQPTTLEHMRASLCEFLSAYKTVTIVADWPEDIEHFCRLLVVGPGLRLDTPDLRFHCWRGLDGQSARPHNALEDALGNARAALAQGDG